MIVPILIPSRHDPVRCPSCRRVEDTRTVCRHCGYEYEDEAPSVWEVLGITGAVIVGLWLISALFVWGMNTAMCTSRDAPSGFDRCYPLTEYLTAPVRWVERADLW